MAKFCGKCGAKLNETTGECLNCEYYNGKQQVEKQGEVKNGQEITRVTYNQKDFKKKRSEIKREKKIQKKIAKREKRAQWSIWKKISRTFLKAMTSILLLLIFFVGITGGLVYFDVVEFPFLSELKPDKLLGFVNEKNIIVEEKNIVMTNETEGTAAIVVKLPDYELLFKEALSSDNPERYLLKKLILKDYEVQKFEMSVSVTTDNGEKIIHTEEAVHKVLEEALLDAINALAEVE